MSDHPAIHRYARGVARTSVSASILIAVSFAAVAGSTASAQPAPAPEPYLDGLAFPTNMAFAPDGRLFFTEKDTGNVRVVSDGELRPRPFVTIAVLPEAERGMLGIAIGPDFAQQPWIYLYYSDAVDGRNRLVRVPADGATGGQPEVLLEGLDSAPGYHNGGDLVFGTDGTLFASLGEAHDARHAQDPSDLGGKIVRLNPDGSVPADNPFGPTNPVWSYGHRNSFGLCVDPANGRLWETENGPDVDDEINLIEAGANYGWPSVTGRQGGDEFTRPVAVFPDTIAVTGCAVVDGDLYFGSFDGRVWRLPAAARSSGDVEEIARLGSGVTDVLLGPDHLLYIATSDAIWTLEPLPGDEAAETPTPPPTSAGPPSSSPTPTPPGAEPTSGTRWVITLLAALAIAGGLIARFAAGRRLRKDR
jgi:glucose/arabinose dehydrogenase